MGYTAEADTSSLSTGPAEYTFTVPQGSNQVVEFVSIGLTLTDCDLNDTTVSLTSPSGTVVVMHEPRTYYQTSSDTTSLVPWFMSVATYGESSAGAWTLTVQGTLGEPGDAILTIRGIERAAGLSHSETKRVGSGAKVDIEGYGVSTWLDGLGQGNSVDISLYYPGDSTPVTIYSDLDVSDNISTLGVLSLEVDLGESEDIHSRRWYSKRPMLCVTPHSDGTPYPASAARALCTQALDVRSIDTVRCLVVCGCVAVCILLLLLLVRRVLQCVKGKRGRTVGSSQPIGQPVFTVNTAEWNAPQAVSTKA
ncbi:hypothetical protein KIPB_002669 [Kipferlia bialata]|uniref:P/Homo B domain-containing protein n=1 Tax=Kipferlia bialata TaxID=797122 RepID=A0A9K3GGF6_9EUKA|nr:hypothetical protein KIPB_002669 [Kipferlia bialata]|eukprot:g2669.t1